MGKGKDKRGEKSMNAKEEGRIFQKKKSALTKSRKKDSSGELSEVKSDCMFLKGRMEIGVPYLPIYIGGEKVVALFPLL